MLEKGEINSANAQKLLAMMVETGRDPSHLMEENNLGQNFPDNELEELVKRLVSENPKQVEEIKAGKIALVKWFVGAIMKTTDGRANPAKAEEMVKKEIGE
jgi:aspartyl-tRNA(Asn)/glutamyl-tRNA(Gln) amidotransferase subunit B